jgi:hypothetical protein
LIVKRFHPLGFITQVEAHLMRAPDSEEVRCALDLIAVWKQRFVVMLEKKRRKERLLSLQEARDLFLVKKEGEDVHTVQRISTRSASDHAGEPGASG